MNQLATVLCVLAVVCATFAAPIEQEPIPIVRQSADGPNPDGSYSYSYETGNGIQAQEDGHLENVGTDLEAMQVQGGFAYSAPDGSPIQLTYVANENGFQPQGDHLPTTPPVPPLILKALEYIAAHPEENGVDAQQ